MQVSLLDERSIIWLKTSQYLRPPNIVGFKVDRNCREKLDRYYTAIGLHKSLLWHNISLFKWIPWASGVNIEGRETWLYVHVEVKWRPRCCRTVWSLWDRKPITQYILLRGSKQQVGNDGWCGWANIFLQPREKIDQEIFVTWAAWQIRRILSIVSLSFKSNNVLWH